MKQKPTKPESIELIVQFPWLHEVDLPSGKVERLVRLLDRMADHEFKFKLQMGLVTIVPEPTKELYK